MEWLQSVGLPSELLPESTSGDDDEAPWKAFLPFLSDEFTPLIFRCFLRRAAAILSAIDFSAPHLPPLPENKSELLEFATFKLLNVSLALLKMYNSTTDKAKKLSFLGVLAKEQGFVYFSIRLACKVVDLYGDPVIPLWLGPATGFLGLIAWTLDTNDDLFPMLEKRGLLVAIMNQLRQLSSETTQKLTQDKCLTQTIWLSVRILFRCATKSRRIRLLYIQHNCSQLLLLLREVPDVEVRLLVKTLLTCIAFEQKDQPSQDSDNSLQLLTDEELSTLKRMVVSSNTLEPFSFHGLSYEILFSMLKVLAKDRQNFVLFTQAEFPSFLAELADEMESDEQREEIADLIWTLMQDKSQDDTEDTAETGGDTGDTIADSTAKEQEVAVFNVLPQREATIEFVELLLRYLLRTVLPYEGISLENSANDLSDSTWFNISECILLLSLILGESSDSIKADIVNCFVAFPGACRAMQLAIEMGILIPDEGLAKNLMTNSMTEFVKISMTLSDYSHDLAREMARSGCVHTFVSILQAGACLNTLTRDAVSRIACSLYALLNLAYDPTNYPAFFFTEAISTILEYVKSPNFDLAATATFTLSCMHMHLDCDHLLALKLSDKEAEYCISTLKDALQSPEFKGDGFSVQEILQILMNLTHPSHTSVELVCESVTSRKGKVILVPDYFDQKLITTAMELASNCRCLIDKNIIPVLKGMVRDKHFLSSVCRILWHLLHQNGIRNKMGTGLYEMLDTLRDSSLEEEQLSIHCCLWLLGKADEKDLEGSLRYAQGCYRFKSYSEVAAVCSKTIENATGKEHENLKHQATLLKGKAVFYYYQRKIFYLMERKPSMSRADEKQLTGDCFKLIEEAINLLGNALDNLYIDEEGSMLLDWAMMDCVRETNQLNQCGRCLLCRRRGVNLCKSHIFPKFMLKEMVEAENLPPREKRFLFGHNKYQMKSAGECWLWLCCKRCEGIMTQNAENDFSQLFPSSGTVEYSSWLFNYCCTIIFRTLSCVKFPRTFNDKEVYDAFLFCRKHLLSLPVKTKDALTLPSDSEDYQHHIFPKTVPKKIDPFLVMTPSTITFEREGGTLEEVKLHSAIPWLAPHRLIDGHKDLAGWSHFFVAYSNGMSILLRFQPSHQCSVPANCLVSPQKGTYTIPDESEAIKLIPKGLWMLYHRSALKTFRDYTEVLRQIAPTAAEKMASRGHFLLFQTDSSGQPFSSQQSESIEEMNRDTADMQLGTAKESPNITDKQQSHLAKLSQSIGEETTGDTSAQPDPTTNTASSRTKIQGKGSIVRFQSASNKPQLNLLPPGFSIDVSVNTSVKLPPGHQIILHHVEESHGISTFLAVGDSDQFLPDKPYVIYHLKSSSTVIHVDGGFITSVDGEICFSQFLMEHSINSKVRIELQMEAQEDVKARIRYMLSENGFLSLELFVQYLRCRQSMRGASDLPSLAKKCSANGCWYCRDLCHCCMKRTSSSISRGKETHEAKHRYCSKKCVGMFCVDPAVMSMSMFVVDHREEFSLGKLKGPSILDIIKMIRREDCEYNTIDFIHLCLGDGSDGLPHGEPYILWQVRSIDSQCYMSFHTTRDCVPTGSLWPRVSKDGPTLMPEWMKLQPKLSEILNMTARALRCDSITQYIQHFVKTKGVHP